MSGFYDSYFHLLERVLGRKGERTEVEIEGGKGKGEVERGKGRERCIFSPLVHFPGDCSSAITTSGPGGSHGPVTPCRSPTGVAGVPHRGGRGPSVWTIICKFPGALAGDLIGSEITRLGPALWDGMCAFQAKS